MIYWREGKWRHFDNSVYVCVYITHWKCIMWNKAHESDLISLQPTVWKKRQQHPLAEYSTKTVFTREWNVQQHEQSDLCRTNYFIQSPDHLGTIANIKDVVILWFPMKFNISNYFQRLQCINNHTHTCITANYTHHHHHRHHKQSFFLIMANKWIQFHCEEMTS